MASVNFMKLKTSQSVKAKVRHCDKEQRLSTKTHSNKQLNKSETVRNFQMKRTYAEVCEMYDERIAFLDSQENANKRKDRVTCFGLTIPFPKNFDSQNDVEWTRKVHGIINSMYGKENVLQVYAHRDEKHTYVEHATGEERESRNHLHVYVIPEIDGRLNGKAFSSKERMKELNERIHEMSLSDYGLEFMDGSKKRSKKSVEELKNESEVLERKSVLNALEGKIEANKGILMQMQQADARETELNEKEKRLKLRERAVGLASDAQDLTTSEKPTRRLPGM